MPLDTAAATEVLASVAVVSPSSPPQAPDASSATNPAAAKAALIVIGILGRAYSRSAAEVRPKEANLGAKARAVERGTGRSPGDRLGVTAVRPPFRKSPLRWRLTVGLDYMRPTVWAYAETFAEAVEIAQGIEWGFEAADAGEPDLERTYNLGSKKKRELAGWLDRLSILEEDEAAKRGEVSLSLGTGYFTRPSGQQSGLPMELKIRLLTKDERRNIARAR